MRKVLVLVWQLVGIAVGLVILGGIITLLFFAK